MKKYILPLSIFMCFALSLSAQWQETNGIYEGATVASISNSTTVFFSAGTMGLYSCNINDTIWNRLETTQLAKNFRSLAVQGDTVYAANSGYGFYVSYDNGVTFNNISTASLNSRQLLINYIGTDTLLFLATNLTGLKSSSDGGITWNTIAFSGISVKSLAIEDTLIFVSLGTQIHRSFDDGITWQIVRNGINNSLSDNLLILGTNIFHGTSSGIYCSTDTGSTWTQRNNGLSDIRVTALQKDGTKIFAGTKSGLFMSQDTGQTWISMNNGLNNLEITTITIAGGKIYCGTLYGSIYISSNNGNSWTKFNDGFTANTCTQLISSNNRLFSVSRFGVYASDDEGDNWYRSDAFGSTDTFYNSLKISTKYPNVYACNENKIAVSNDNGVSWTNGQTPTIFTNMLCTFENDTNVLAGSSDGLISSVDTCQTWTAIYIDSSNPLITTLLRKDSMMLAGTRYYGIYISHDIGQTWSFSGLNGLEIENFDTIGSTIFVYAENSGIYRSIDNGLSWQMITTVGQRTICLKAVGQALFMVSPDNGILLSYDLGNTWTNVSGNLPEASVHAIEFHLGYLYAGTYSSGIWKSNYSLITNLTNGIKTCVSSIFPNPSSENTTITLNKNKDLLVSVIDIRGKTLLSEKYYEANKIDINTAQFASGIYFVNLKYTDFSETKKIIVTH